MLFARKHSLVKLGDRNEGMVRGVREWPLQTRCIGKYMRSGIHGAISADSRIEEEEETGDSGDDDASAATKPASTRAVVHAIAFNRWLMVELSAILVRACRTEGGIWVF